MRRVNLIKPGDKWIMLSLARAYLDADALQQALDTYNSYFEIDPTSPEAYAGRGMVYLRRGQADRAIGDARKVVALNPGDASAWFILGTTHMAAAANRTGEAIRDEYRKAEEALSEGLRRQPDEIRIISARASLYERLGETDKAFVDYKRLIKIAPGNELAREALKRLEGS